MSQRSNLLGALMILVASFPLPVFGASGAGAPNVGSSGGMVRIQPVNPSSFPQSQSIPFSVIRSPYQRAYACDPKHLLRTADGWRCR
jgi:hypothetical protein